MASLGIHSDPQRMRGSCNLYDLFLFYYSDEYSEDLLFYAVYFILFIQNSYIKNFNKHFELLSLRILHWGAMDF